MKENAIIVRQLDIIKVYVDFSNIDNVYRSINADLVSTIHTVKTQEISEKLGFHIIGFVDREGNDINNNKACQISGYDYIGSFMLLCKTDDKYNALPLDEKELDSLYTYLTTGKVVDTSFDAAQAFFNRYGIENPLSPRCAVRPDVYYKEEVPYMILLRYEFAKMSDKEQELLGAALFPMSSRIFEEGFKDIDGVKESPDGKYYVNFLFDENRESYNVLMQAKDPEVSDEILLYDTKNTINGFLGKIKPPKNAYGDTASEEAGDIDED